MAPDNLTLYNMMTSPNKSTLMRLLSNTYIMESKLTVAHFKMFTQGKRNIILKKNS